MEVFREGTNHPAPQMIMRDRDPFLASAAPGRQQITAVSYYSSYPFQ